MTPRRGPARCRTCQQAVVFFGSPFTGALRTFDPKPVEPSHALAGVKAFPVLSRSAYKPADLTDHLQVQRQSSREAAEAEVLDIPWHLIHECPPSHQDTP